MAERTRSPRLGDRAVCYYARSCAFLLLSRGGRKDVAGFYANVEAMDE